MITFDIQTLNAFFEENKNFFINARVNKIQQPTRREFILTLRNQSESKQLYININPKYYHICFMNEDNGKKRLLEIPKQPPMFCMQLRKYLENSKVIRVNLPKNERILELYFESSNNIGDNIYPCLAVELMGKYSNVILYNTDSKIIIGCAHNVGAEKSRLREVYGGIPYIYPPKQNQSTVPKFKSLICEYDFNQYGSVNNLIDTYYADQIAFAKFSEKKAYYKSITAQKLNKVKKSLSKMENKIKSDSDLDKYRLYGDLLMANIYQLKDYSRFAEVYDYENNKNITMPLDETKTVKDNANKFYKLYTKSKNAREKLSELINSYTVQKDYLQQIQYFLESAENIEDLNEISPEITEEKPSKKEKNKISEIPKIEYPDGTRIYIGKNNKQNDYIISKLASDEDLWFHVHNNAGSHVLLKTQNLTDELIMTCAKFAKEHSSVKNSSKIGVIYTKRKYLRKPPGANLGYVTYKNEKEIVLD